MPAYDLGDFLADDALLLKGVVSEKYPKGHDYKVKSPSAQTGLQLRKVMRMWDAQDDAEIPNPPTQDDIATLLALVTDGEGELVELHVKLMGATYDEMVADGVSDDRLSMIVSIVTVHYGRGSQVAQMMIAAAGDSVGERSAPNRQTRRSQPKKAGSKSRKASTGTRGRTPSQGSTPSSPAPSGTAPEAKTG